MDQLRTSKNRKPRRNRWNEIHFPPPSIAPRSHRAFLAFRIQPSAFASPFPSVLSAKSAVKSLSLLSPPLTQFPPVQSSFLFFNAPSEPNVDTQHFNGESEVSPGESEVSPAESEASPSDLDSPGSFFDHDPATHLEQSAAAADRRDGRGEDFFELIQQPIFVEEFVRTIIAEPRFF